MDVWTMRRRVSGAGGALLGSLLVAAWCGAALGSPEPRPLQVAARSADRAGARLAAVAGPGEIQVTWDRPGGRDVLYYLVYRGEGRDPDLGGDPYEMVKGLRFVDTRALPGLEYRYAVVPVERNGVRLPATAFAAVRATSAAGPRIAGVAVEPSGRPLRPGDVVTVVLTGPSGAQASADLGGLASDLPLREKGRTGRYVGTYVVKARDQGVRKVSARVVGHLSDASGVSDLAGPEVLIAGRSEMRDTTAPVIAKASHDGWKVEGFSGKLVAGDVLTVTAEGEPGATARFELAGLTGSLPMQESRPGVYAGSYTVRWGDSEDEARVLVHLSDDAGNESSAQAGRPVALDTRVRLTVSARDPILPADGRSETRVVAHAANANGDEVSGHEIAFSLLGRDALPASNGGERGKRDEGELELKWGGVTDAFGDAVGTFTAGRAAGDFLILAKDLTTGDAGVGWVATGEGAPAKTAAKTARTARAARGAVSGSLASSPAAPTRAAPPTPAQVRGALGTFFVPRFYEGQERERVRVADWLVEPGDKVEKGQTLVALETPRGIYKISSPAKGVLHRRGKATRDRVELGDVLGSVEIDPEAWKTLYGK